jgi:phage I-like protein
MKRKTAIRIILPLAGLFALLACAVWLIANGVLSSKVLSTEDRANLEKEIGSALSDGSILQLHQGWTDATSYYRLSTTEEEYATILRSGTWTVDTRDKTEGFRGRPRWWRPPVESPEWTYLSRQLPYGTGGFAVLIRHAGSKGTYFMMFTE